MGSGARSPLGELLLAYRRQVGLSQEELSARTSALSLTDDTVGPVSVRTIISLEKLVRGSANWRRPRRDTAHALAVALDLAPGTAAYHAFMAAARQESEVSPDPEPTGDVAPPRFVMAGREPHLGRLEAAIDAAAGGTATALLVRGEIGSGKTSIIEHACRLALDRHPNAVVLWSACTEASPRSPGVVPHEPFLRLIRLMLGDSAAVNSREIMSHANQQRITEREPIAAHALANDGPLLAAIALAGDVPWTQLAARVRDDALLDRLRDLAGSGPSAALRTVSGCEQFYRVLRRYAESGPVILVMEDIQWGDPTTLASLDHLLNRMYRQQRLPVIVITSCQPEAVDTSPSPELAQVLEEIQRSYRHATVDLADTLTGDAARAFIAALAATSPVSSGPDVIDAILARTDGNPLYVTELVGLLEEEAALAPADALDRIRTAVPPALAASFDARVRALPAELGQLLTTASVLGAEFFAETLMQMLDLPTARFIDLVDRQLGRQHRLIRADGTLMVGSRTTHRYRFHPPILRDHVYGQLSALARTHAHQDAAQALVALHSDEGHPALARIAHHFDRAGNHVEAARFHLKAGDRARDAREFADATVHLQRVADLNVRRDDPATWIMSLISLGLIARAQSDQATARKHLGHALDLATTHRLPGVRAKALEALGMLEYDAGNLDAGVALVREAIDIWDASDDSNASRAMANLSYILYGQGRYADAIAIANRGRTVATRTGRERAWVDASIALANCWLDLGRWAEATELDEGSLHICRDLGDHHRARLCWLNLAQIAIEQGDWGAAEAAIDRIASDDEPISDPLAAAVALYSGEIAEGRHSIVAARAHFQRSLEIREREGQHAAVIDALAGLLRIATQVGDLDDAAELLRDIERRLGERGRDGVERIGRLYLALVQADDALDRPDDARRWLAEGVMTLNIRAGNITNLAHRESYLNNPPVHRWLIETASARGVVVG
jgi:tetratricopeptide (TPR) repeat protein